MSKKKFEKKFEKIQHSTTSQPLIKASELVPFKGTVKQFIQSITLNKPGYIKTGKAITHLWWEDKEMWFMNYGTQRRRDVATYGWYIAKDLENIIKGYINEEGIMCFK